MKRVLVKYKVKPDKSGENEQFIKGVFEELRQNSPAGLRYASFKQDDNVTFVHIASIETEGGNNPLAETAAFKRFQEKLKDRCDEPPVANNVTLVGSYRLF
ncbi:MAG: hypothetical protein OEV30_00655 [Ignavibacteria bacterium]|nr:hypothetical protein [Ignavibacteria bacterium]